LISPVLPVLKYSDLDDAIARANGTEYGLGGTVWGADLRISKPHARWQRAAESARLPL
jgi:acyl-CoA reductase-like NAD-dependent aldehyde dehydrogenase